MTTTIPNVPPPADAELVYDWEDLSTPDAAWRPFRACQRTVPADYEMGARPYIQDIEVFIWGEQSADGSIPTREICVNHFSNRSTGPHPSSPDDTLHPVRQTDNYLS